mmetsp:Transcript_11750/g.23375  ORF Transcript_11750/g.23375 Transcript_11750/m.23375 type:complete len:191 (+) Transcript_11750:187-759(+)
MDALGAFLTDVVINSTTDLTRAFLIGCVAVLMSPLPPGNRGLQGAAERAKVAGAWVVLIGAAFLVARRGVAEVARGADEGRALVWEGFGSSHGDAARGPIKERAAAVVKNSIKYVKDRPYQFVSAACVLFLADLLNLGVVVDRLDPLVRLGSGVWRPIAAVGRRVVGMVKRQRMMTATTNKLARKAALAK